jgi:hypothetical protein
MHLQKALVKYQAEANPALEYDTNAMLCLDKSERQISKDTCDPRGGKRDGYSTQ